MRHQGNTNPRRRGGGGNYGGAANQGHYAASTTGGYAQHGSAASGGPAPLAAWSASANCFADPQFYKHLERASKPNPPWAFGSPARVTNLADELALFADFTSATPQEIEEIEALQRDVQAAVRKTWDDKGLTVAFSGLNAAGIFPYEFPLHRITPHSPNPNEPLPPRAPLHLIAKGTQNLRADNAIAQGLVAALIDVNFTNVAAVTDYRGTHAISALHTGTHRSILLRYGQGTERCRVAGQEFSKAFSRRGSAQQHAMICVDALLRQCRIIDDVQASHLSSEAAGVMVLSVINSYGTDAAAVPTSDRILIDFFLMYGFQQAFNPEQASVRCQGVADGVERKRHPHASLSVLDPGDPTENLTAGVGFLKLQHTLAIFGYCYRVLDTYCKEVDDAQRRAQSPLSTVLGGEPLWPRLVRLYQDGVEPFYSALASKLMPAAQQPQDPSSASAHEEEGEPQQDATAASSSSSQKQQQKVAQAAAN